LRRDGSDRSRWFRARHSRVGPGVYTDGDRGERQYTGVLSAQPANDFYVGSPYLNRGLSGFSFGVGLGLNVVTRHRIALALEFSTARPLEVHLEGRLVSGEAVGRLHDRFYSILAGYAAQRSLHTTITALAGIAFGAAHRLGTVCRSTSRSAGSCGWTRSTTMALLRSLPAWTWRVTPVGESGSWAARAFGGAAQSRCNPTWRGQSRMALGRRSATAARRIVTSSR